MIDGKNLTDPNFLFQILLMASVLAGVDGFPASDFTWSRKKINLKTEKKNLFNVQLVSRMSKPTILTFDGLDVVSRVSEESRSSMDFA